MSLLLKNLLFTLLIPGTVGVYLPLIIARGRGLAAFPPLVTLGVVLYALGACAYAWTVWDFATSGKGTPFPLSGPRKLVVRGLYQYTRNPMYLGVILVIFGWAALFASGWLVVYALGVWLFNHLFVVFYEEPRLKQLFGEEYEAYRAEVSRWLPHLPRKPFA